MATTEKSGVEKVEGEEAWFSVWAIPPEPVTKRLKEMMRALRSDFGGPEFEPHITVVGAMSLAPSEAIRRFHASCDGAASYTANVSSVAIGGFFFQCVFLLVDPTPQVVETSKQCCRHFGYKTSQAYMPHLSLLYGDLSNEVKERAREKVKAFDDSILDLHFEVSELVLYKTDVKDKTLKSWEKIASCKLKSTE